MSAVWQEIGQTKNMAALSCFADYVISHRPNQFCAIYRPTGEHFVIGDFKTLKDAKSACIIHFIKTPLNLELNNL